jgi:hypothetical protein
MSYNNILEEELKNKVGHDYFAAYNHTDIIDRIDFAVAHPKPSSVKNTISYGQKPNAPTLIFIKPSHSSSSPSEKHAPSSASYLPTTSAYSIAS